MFESKRLGFTYYTLIIKTTNYYTQIDNNIEKIESTDEMEYQYKLKAYNKNGDSKEVVFKTSRELRDKAFLELKYMDVRGVANWQEIEYDKLPSKVQEKYNK